MLQNIISLFASPNTHHCEWVQIIQEGYNILPTKNEVQAGYMQGTKE